ncbi:hypothetical protein [Dysgonomonas macrotermitis]|uniref:Uncharacterized protein n=1 Tax=Dysgonomonas macrotermitis TaxID=1346286 RepID=A0A1M4THL3_9BACT|nr:hypothetical protein [Dysgonomonas macrotermitis]SHE43950.1 hypothetical protein SAMN05444362_101330 [Dysgonomonas macrotermitis]
MKYKIIFLLACMYFYPLKGQISPVKEQNPKGYYLDIYPPETLENKGILYPETEQTLSTEPSLTLIAYNEHGGQEELLYNGFLSFKGSLVFPPIINVIGQDSEYYQLAFLTEIFDRMPTRYLKVSKRDIATLGYQYLSLNSLVEIYKKHPEITQNVVGYPLQRYKPVSLQRGMAYVLREKPEDAAPYIIMNMPTRGHGAPTSTTILARDGYWFELELHYRFIYNGSSNPAVCARSQFDEKFKGYWKANTDELGFPYLLLDILKHEYKKRIPELVKAI